MAFDPLDILEIESGDAVTQDLWNTTRLNFDDHETRITSLEGGSAVAYVPIFFEVNGPYKGIAPLTQLGFWRVPFNITVLAGRVWILKAGSGGTTEIDFLFKRGVAAFTSIFSTKPALASGSGDLVVSSNGVLSTSALLAGDFVRMDLTAAQTGDPIGFQGILEFQKT